MPLFLHPTVSFLAACSLHSRHIAYLFSYTRRRLLQWLIRWITRQIIHWIACFFSYTRRRLSRRLAHWITRHILRFVSDTSRQISRRLARWITCWIVRLFS